MVSEGAVISALLLTFPRFCPLFRTHCVTLCLEHSQGQCLTNTNAANRTNIAKNSRYGFTQRRRHTVWGNFIDSFSSHPCYLTKLTLSNAGPMQHSELAKTVRNSDERATASPLPSLSLCTLCHSGFIYLSFYNILVIFHFPSFHVSICVLNICVFHKSTLFLPSCWQETKNKTSKIAC